jgi:hypothetical protein
LGNKSSESKAIIDRRQIFVAALFICPVEASVWPGMAYELDTAIKESSRIATHLELPAHASGSRAVDTAPSKRFAPLSVSPVADRSAGRVY